MTLKKIRLYFKGNRIEDQYHLDLQDNITPQDYDSILDLFNKAAYQRPPPGSSIIYIAIWSFLWIVAGSLVYLLWLKYNNFYILATLPLYMLISALLMSILHRYKALKFEASIVQICSQLNATENIRGIHFSFSKDGAIHSLRFWTRIKSVYAIDIEVDDRFVALKSHRFNRRSPSEDDMLASPKLVYVNYHNVDEKNHDKHMFLESPPAWSPPYSEKTINHLA